MMLKTANDAKPASALLEFLFVPGTSLCFLMHVIFIHLYRGSVCLQELQPRWVSATVASCLPSDMSSGHAMSLSHLLVHHDLDFHL